MVKEIRIDRPDADRGGGAMRGAGLRLRSDGHAADRSHCGILHGCPRYAGGRFV